MEATTRRAPTGRAVTALAPGGGGKALSTREGWLPHSEWRPEQAVVEREIAKLGHVPGLVRLQKREAFICMVREALDGEGGPRG